MPARSLTSHVRRALAPEPGRAMVAVGVAVVVYLVVAFLAVRGALVMAGHPTEGLTHAVLPPLFGGMLAFIGSLGGSLRSGVLRAAALSILALPLTLVAIGSRDVPLLAGATLAVAAVGAGYLAWHGEPFATLGSLLLYMYFLPLVFGAGSGVALRYLVIGFAAMAAVTIAMRALAAAVPHRQRPGRAAATDEPHRSLSSRWQLLPEPRLRALRRTTVRSALGLGLGAVVMSATGDHNAVWVLMTLIALIPPYLPLTIDRVLARLVGTVVAMVVLTVVAATVPPGPGRFLLLAVGLVLTIAFLRRSYLISVLGVSLVAVISYAQVDGPLGQALLWRGLDTAIGAVIAIVVTLLIPVGDRPHPVWAD